MEVIILAGGKGTRLRKVVSHVPKPMAEINGQPFLKYILQFLSRYHVTNIVMSVGYKQEVIQSYFNDMFYGIPIQYSCEQTPLGTGGAIKQAIPLLNTCDSHVIIINGDTYFDINLDAFYIATKNDEISIAIKPMKNFDRYGAVKIKGNKVLTFTEKKHVKQGFINTGIYCVKKSILDSFKYDIFSFETYLQNRTNIMVYKSDGYFVDIGIPEDYAKAQKDIIGLF